MGPTPILPLTVPNAVLYDISCTQDTVLVVEALVFESVAPAVGTVMGAS